MDVVGFVGALEPEALENPDAGRVVRVGCWPKDLKEAVCVLDDRGRGLEGESATPIAGPRARS